jgi:hypothetical protein
VMREDNCVIRLTKMTSVSDSDERTSQAERCGFTTSFCLTSNRHQSRTISGSACSALRTLAYALRDKCVGAISGVKVASMRGGRGGGLSLARAEGQMHTPISLCRVCTINYHHSRLPKDKKDNQAMPLSALSPAYPYASVIALPFLSSPQACSTSREGRRQALS